MSHTCPIKDAKVALERLHKMLFDTRREAGIDDGDACSKPVMSTDDAAKFATTLELNRSEWYDWCAVRHLLGDVEVEIELVHKAVERENENARSDDDFKHLPKSAKSRLTVNGKPIKKGGIISALFDQVG